MASHAIALYDSLASSNIPSNEKTHLRKWFETTTGMNLSAMSPARPGTMAKGAIGAIRQSGEAVLVGALLALANVELKDGLDVYGAPADGVAAVMLNIGATLWAHSELAPDARNIASSCFTVWSFRETTNLLMQKRMAKGKTVPPHLIPGNKIHGESQVGSEDPIVRAARAL
jgi:hypothetical protein